MGASSTIRRLAFNRWALTGCTLTIAAIVGMGYELMWLRERSEIVFALKLDTVDSVSAPGMLWVFGERGYSEIAATIFAEPGTERMDYAQMQLRRIKRAFPEAQVTTVFRKSHDDFPWQERYRGEFQSHDQTSQFQSSKTTGL